MATTAVAMITTIKHYNTSTFDIDSVPVGIDNRCSACISHDINDFVGEVQKLDKIIGGYAGNKTTNFKTGTIRWQF